MHVVYGPGNNDIVMSSNSRIFVSVVEGVGAGAVVVVAIQEK
jgi:hypothetical protein